MAEEPYAQSHKMPLISSSRPDGSLLNSLALARTVLLTLVGLVSSVIALGWLIPAFGQLLPDGWALMKFNTALCMGLMAASINLSRPQQSTRRLIWSRVVASFVIVIAGSALYEHVSDGVTWIDIFFVADPASPHPGRMAIQTAIYLVGLGVITLFARSRKSITSNLIDLLTLLLVVLVLVVLAGYCFGASNLFGQSPYVRTSPQTLFCMILLALVAVGRRADYGYYSVLIGVGIGSRVVRLMLPIALILPFMLVVGGAYSTLAGWLSTPYAAALTAATISSLMFCMLIILGWRINGLEGDLRDMSLTDELTQIYNRRGFLLLGEQALLETRRGDSALAILYFDLDGLKLVNDSYGHDVGSQCVKDMAILLKSIFRDADIIARVGGDEFAVVAHTDAAGTRAVMNRLDAATVEFNTKTTKQYQISYSVGEAFYDLATEESFASIVNRADAMMYSQKRAKKDSAKQS